MRIAAWEDFARRTWGEVPKRHPCFLWRLRDWDSLPTFHTLAFVIDYFDDICPGTWWFLHRGSCCDPTRAFIPALVPSVRYTGSWLCGTGEGLLQRSYDEPHACSCGGECLDDLVGPPHTRTVVFPESTVKRLLSKTHSVQAPKEFERNARFFDHHRNAVQPDADVAVG
jgi:hypothetical protein